MTIVKTIVNTSGDGMLYDVTIICAKAYFLFNLAALYAFVPPLYPILL